jgi:hypothetical protein
MPVLWATAMNDFTSQDAFRRLRVVQALSVGGAVPIDATPDDVVVAESFVQRQIADGTLDVALTKKRADDFAAELAAKAKP